MACFHKSLARNNTPQYCVLKKGDGPVLWLESPLDTVPAGDPENWQTTLPFITEIINYRMIGRGVADARLVTVY